jgi:hypothetical protein
MTHISRHLTYRPLLIAPALGKVREMLSVAAMWMGDDPLVSEADSGLKAEESGASSKSYAEAPRKRR